VKKRQLKLNAREPQMGIPCAVVPIAQGIPIWGSRAFIFSCLFFTAKDKQAQSHYQNNIFRYVKY
jgi:hypothetical protein